jgi:peptide/nickel transport system substrate-binding protein
MTSDKYSSLLGCVRVERNAGHNKTTSIKKQRMKIICLIAVLTAGWSIEAAHGQAKSDILVVAGPRTPESLDEEYPPTEEGHEARRNIYERLLAYASKKDDNGITVENFDVIQGDLADHWTVDPDKKSITFSLRKGVKSGAGNELTANDLMWTFERGWNLKATLYWYFTQVLKIADYQSAFQKVDDYTVKVSIPNSSPLIERLWVNNDLGIIDSTEAKKHVTPDDPWASKWLSTNSASFAPYAVSKFASGQEVDYEANPNYFRGPARIKQIIFREMPTSSNRVAAVQAGAVDVAEWLQPRELALLEKDSAIKIWKVFSNYIFRLEMNTNTKPFTDPKVRQAMNYLVPREDILKSILFNTGRITKSPISEIYPAFTDSYYNYSYNLEKAKQLLADAGLPNGFQTDLFYRTNEPIQQEMAVVLKSSFAKAGVNVKLNMVPASTLVEDYTKGKAPMYFFRDMAIVPDAAYVANLWLNSASLINYSKFHNTEVDQLIDSALTMTDESKRVEMMKRVQQIVMEEAPWVFLFNPGYQLAARSNVKGFSWYTPNGNSWYDFSK